MASSITVDPIDVGYLGLERAAAAFVIRRAGGAPILIECGTAACQPKVRAALHSLGIDRGDQLAGLFVTHIHLDHAGGAGHWVSEGATLYVHPFGVRHMLDPAKLIASSRRVHGAAYDRWYGDPLPCDPTRVRAVTDREVIACGGLRVTAFETPGHARHHHAWLVEAEGERHLFTGDVASMRVPGSTFISVPTPPPEFDLAAWRASLDVLDQVVADAPTRLWLTHFGEMPDAAAHLREARDRLEAEVAHVNAILDSGVDEAEQIARYGAWLWPLATTAGVTEAARSHFLGPHFCRMNLNGIRRWREA